MKLNEMTTWSAAALVLATMAGGCAEKAVDIGDNEPPGVLGASLSDYQGTWVGHAELATWVDGTDTVRLMLDASGNGVIEIGEAASLPAPVVDEVFPPTTVDVWAPVLGMVSGFSYPVEGATVESNRIQMSSSSGELYRQWCELQTPMLVAGIDPTTHTCAGATIFTTNEMGCFVGAEEPLTPIDCDRVACALACSCDETSCGSSSDAVDIRLDAQLRSEGEELSGSFETPHGVFQVQMTRE